MKKLLVIPFVFMIYVACAQPNPVKVVFDITSNLASTHESAVRHLNFMSEHYPDGEFELVVYSGALSMVLKDETTVADDIHTLLNRKNVSILVCEETMKRHKIDKSQLLPKIGMVPDGILEIVTRQGAGWGYIKEAHN